MSDEFILWVLGTIFIWWYGFVEIDSRNDRGYRWHLLCGWSVFGLIFLVART
jgi:hypothetical protein